MPTWTDVVNRFRHLVRRSRFDLELDHEIRFHLDARADELEEASLARRDAVAQARREFGSETHVREAKTQCR